MLSQNSGELGLARPAPDGVGAEVSGRETRSREEQQQAEEAGDGGGCCDAGAYVGAKHVCDRPEFVCRCGNDTVVAHALSKVPESHRALRREC